MFSSVIGIDTVKGAWSNKKCKLGWIKWLLSSIDLLQRNIRSITEFDSPSVSEYLVGIGLVGSGSSKLKESAIIIRSSLIDKRWGKERSHKLSLMLKSAVVMRRLWMFISISLRYFEAEWEESEYTFIIKEQTLLLKKEIKRMSLWLIMSFQRNIKMKDRCWYKPKLLESLTGLKGSWQKKAS